MVAVSSSLNRKSPMKTLEFFYDPISPYAMLGFHALPEALVGVSAQVRYTPVLFGAMLRANDTKGPAEIATKRDWTFRHVHWLAKRAGITLVDPAQHPFPPVALLRLALAAADADAPAHTNRWVTEQMFAHVWQSQGQDVNDRTHMAALASRQVNAAWAESGSGCCVACSASMTRCIPSRLSDCSKADNRDSRLSNVTNIRAACRPFVF